MPIKMRRNKKSKATITLKSKSKLTIELPEENILSTPKFNKNSPVYNKTSKFSKPGTVKKQKSHSLVRKPLFIADSPSKTPKYFKFPTTPKASQKKQKIKSPSNLSKKLFQISTPVSKISNSPLEKKKLRPTTASATERGSLKAETGSSPSLKSMVTQVNFSPKPPVLSASEIQTRSETLYKEHLFQTFQAMKFVRTLQPVNLEDLKLKRITLPRRAGFEDSKTLIFDLDETLVHCCDDSATSAPSVVLPIVFPSGETVQAGINVRPYALECLKEVSKSFEVFVFTASHPCYANVVLDYLDPAKEFIHQRFFRDSCMNVGGVYIKDLRIFANRNLKDLIIIDNAAYSFAYQLENGIPIISWHDDPYDKELFNLMDYVKALAAVDDVREVNEQTFHLRTFYDDYIAEFMANDTLAPA